MDGKLKEIVSLFIVFLLVMLPFNTSLVFAEFNNGTDALNLSDDDAYTLDLEEEEPLESTNSSEIDESQLPVAYGAPAPPLEVSIPEFANSRNVVITGNSSPGSLIDLYINGHPTHFYQVKEDGGFTFRNINLDSTKTNQLRIVGRAGVGGEIVEVIGDVVVDDIAPKFTSLEDLPDVFNTSSVLIKGTLSEPCLVKVIVFNSDTNREDETILGDAITEFSQSVNVDEGISSVTVIAKDIAGNSVEETFTILVDTIPPVIEEDNINTLSPTYSREINIKGRVSEPADVKIIVSPKLDTAFTCPHDSLLSEGSKCYRVAGKDVGVSYTTSTDSDGNFSKRVNLMFDFGLTYEDSVTTNLRSDSTQKAQLNVGTSGFENNIEIIATDRAGNKGSVSDHVTFATCNTADSDFLVWQKDIYPGALVPDHLFQGIAQFSFSLDLNYIGSADHVYVDNIRVSSREISIAESDDWDTNIFRGSDCVGMSNVDGGTEWYITCNLRRWPPDAYRNITKAYDDFKKKQTINLPLELTFSYTETRYDALTGNPTPVSKNQVVCYDIEYVLDLRADPDWIPRSLLEKSVRVLNELISAINDILPRVTQAKWIVAIGCFGSYIVNYFSNIGETAACISFDANQERIIETYLRGSENFELGTHRGSLENALEITGDTEKQSELDRCIAAKQKFLKTGVVSSWLCDRIFCPVVPSAQQYQQDEMSYPRSLSPCSGEVTSITEDDKELKFNTDSPKTMCEIDYQREWASGCPSINPYEESKKLNEPSTGSRSISDFLSRGLDLCSFGQSSQTERNIVYSENNHAIKHTISESGENSYHLVRQRTKEEIVDGEVAQDSSTKQYVRQSINYGDFGTNDNIGENPKLGRDENGCVYVIPTTIGEFDRSSAKHETVGETSVFLSKVAPSPGLPEHYTKECNGGTFLRDANGIIYCQTEDAINRITPLYVETTSNSNNPYSLNNVSNNCLQSDAVGRTSVKKTLVDPTGSMINSVRCVCLPAIEGYLITIRNIANAIKNCFESILVTGEFDSGICRAILTQYLCDFVFDIIGCVGKSFSYTNAELDSPNRAALSPVRTLLTDLRNSGDKIKEGASKRYGNTASFRTLFNERQLIHSLCLAAFGYDWYPALDQAMSMSGGGISINTTAIIAPATRRFMSFNPAKNGIANYVYHVGYYVTAGEPVSWTLELICSTTNDCNEDDYENSICDCAQSSYLQHGGSVQDFPKRPESYYGGYTPLGGGNPEPGIGLTLTVDGGTLQGGESVGGGSGNPYEQTMGTRGTGDLYIPLEHGVRYDKVRLCWTPSGARGSASGEMRTHPGCVGPVPISLVGSRPPAFCTFSLSLGGIYSCGMFSYADGFAYLTSIKENRNGREVDTGIEPISDNEKFSYVINYAMSEPKGDVGEPDKFLRIDFSDENDVRIGKTYTSYNAGNLYDYNGKLNLPRNPITPLELLGNHQNFVGGTTISQITDVTPLTINLVRASLIKINGPSTAHQLFIVNKSGKLYYKFHNTDDSPQNEDGKTFLTGSQYYEANLKNGVEGKLIEIPKNHIIDREGRLSWNIKSTIESSTDYSVNDIYLEITPCTTGPCASFYLLKAGENKLINERCGEKGGDLEWKAVIRIVGADQNGLPTAAPIPKISGRDTEKTVKLLISCGESGSDVPPVIPPCREDVILHSRCNCGDNLFTSGDKQNVCREGKLQENLVPCPIGEGALEAGTEPFTSATPEGRCRVNVPNHTTRKCKPGEFFNTSNNACTKHPPVE